MSHIRVLVVANNLLARTGLVTLLSTQSKLDLVGQIAGGESLSDDMDVYRPDVVVCDLDYDPIMQFAGLSALINMDIPVIALLPDAEYAPETISVLSAAGVYGLLLRDSGATRMSSAVAAVIEGLVVIDPLLADVLVPEIEIANPVSLREDLTPRELEVLQYVAQGLPNKTIGQILGISPNTVKFHVNAILSKLDAQSRTEAVVRATQSGLIVL